MATELSFLHFILDQLQALGTISAKKMFGEYGLYSDEKIFGLVCDNRLFIKPTEAGRNFIENVVEAAPYKGAKPYFLIEDKIENSEWLCELVKITVSELPTPKAKKKK